MGKQLLVPGLLLFLACGCSDHHSAALGPCAPTGGTFTVEGIEFVEIGPGTFLMGGKRREESPVHRVRFAHGFWIARTEITNAQFERFYPTNVRGMGTEGDRQPAAVTWEQAKKYCAWLAAKAGRPIRLPSEAEWECACRAGSDGFFTHGNDVGRLSEYAWFQENSGGRAHDVATRKPNAWGLFDLHGNSGEWCEDTAHKTYEGAPTDGSAWTKGGTGVFACLYRVVRGGGHFSPAEHCRSAARNPTAGYPNGFDGFRPAFVLKGD